MQTAVFTNQRCSIDCDIWEIAVQTYLQMDRGMFINPQYLLGTQKVWEVNPDFLALAFPEGEAWMVEVSIRPSRGLFGKIENFKTEYAPRIEQQLREHTVVCSQGVWTIGLWVFCPRLKTENIAGRMQAAELPLMRVTSTEETLDPGVWDKRHR